jgi:alpha-L-fucosidase 2
LIKLLPALPDKWRAGRVSGLTCRGAISLDLEWDMEGKGGQSTLTANLESAQDQQVTVRFPAPPQQITCRGGAVPAPTGLGPAYRTFDLRAGEPLTVDATF